MMSSPRAWIAPRARLLVALFAAAFAPGCGSNGEPSASSGPLTSTTPAARTSGAPADPVRIVDPTRLSESPTRCAREVAPSANGTATFERPSGAGGTTWTLVMTVSTLEGGSFDAERKAHAFGAIAGEPSLAMENGRLVVRTPVKFTGDPVATVVVGVKCGGETGLVSIGVRWSDSNLDSTTPFEAQIAAVGGT